MSEKVQTIKEPLATIGDRVIAYIIDFFVMQIGAAIGGLVVLIVWLIMYAIDAGGAGIDDGTYMIVLVIFAIIAFLIWMGFDFYYLVFWLIKHEGQTVGKKFKKIRIMVVEDLDPGKIRKMGKGDTSIVILRLVFSIVDVLLFWLVGIYLINSNPNNQRFADQQAKTVVISEYE